MSNRLGASVLLLTLAFFCIPGHLASQQPPTQAQAQGTGANPWTLEQHLRLVFLVGAWEEEITYADSKSSGSKVTALWSARPAMGLYLRFQYEETTPVQPYRAFGVLTYDREEQNYRLWWFDNVAGIGEYRGNFTDENTLVLEHSGAKGGKAYRERIRYTRVSPSEVRTHIERAEENGEFKPYLEAVARPVEPVSASGFPRPPGRD